MYKGAIVGCGAVACQAHVPAWRDGVRISDGGGG